MFFSLLLFLFLIIFFMLFKIMDACSIFFLIWTHLWLMSRCQLPLVQWYEQKVARTKSAPNRLLRNVIASECWKSFVVNIPSSSSILESRQAALTRERVRWMNRPSGGNQSTSMLSDRFGAAATCSCSLAQWQKTLHNGEKWFSCVVSAHVTIPKLKSQVFSIFGRGVLEMMKGSPCHHHCERPRMDVLTGRGPEEGGRLFSSYSLIKADCFRPTTWNRLSLTPANFPFSGDFTCECMKRRMLHYLPWLLTVVWNPSHANFAVKCLQQKDFSKFHILISALN